MTSEDDLENVMYWVGKLMREHPNLRLHKGRKELVRMVSEELPSCSMESITRAQRKLWEFAECAIKKGQRLIETHNLSEGLAEFDYAKNFLPESQEDFIEWLETRKGDYGLFHSFFGGKKKREEG